MMINYFMRIFTTDSVIERHRIIDNRFKESNQICEKSQLCEFSHCGDDDSYFVLHMIQSNAERGRCVSTQEDDITIKASRLARFWGIWQSKGGK